MDIHFLKQQHEQLQLGMQQIEEKLGELLRQKQRQIGAIQMIEVLIRAEGERNEEIRDNTVGNVVNGDAGTIAGTVANADG